MPGALIAGRYRLVGLLGRGGMGEVYRADDLALGQAVALKFLPMLLSLDAERFDRFRSEVRLARQVSHPNVCRVHDIGEFEGHQFLSMEFVDGEDLASLLRRIGRLPVDKATDIARQLCAGLAAAHERGVLHRDLKPGNVMIDGRGHVRITDFGLAAAVVDSGALNEALGTPAYMAPELFEGLPASVRSDIYALGLVLYEIFSGKPAVQGSTLAEIVRLHREHTPSSVSSVIGEVNPAIERVIDRCLAKEPLGRPTSALVVAASLPGSDLITSALERGETPSPELLAAAAEESALATTHAVATTAAIGVMLAVVLWLAGGTHIATLTPMPDSPEVLRSRAATLARTLGYEQAADSTGGFVTSDYLRHVATNVPADQRATRLNTTEPSALLYWYRQSPRPLATLRFGTNGRVSPFDPADTLPGMLSLWLTPEGRLRRLSAVPPATSDSGTATIPDWRPLFEAAGFDANALVEVAPRWTPPAFADVRAAWEGHYARQPDVKIRIEAASSGGRPIYFHVIEPWTRQPGETRRLPSTAQRAIATLIPLLLLAMFGGAIALAIRNTRLGRGDRRGAGRLTAVAFSLTAVAGLLGGDHEPTPTAVLALLLLVLAQSLLVAASVWLGYLALEPYVRRRWPRTLIAWARVLSGHVRNPVVGRDILAGVALGVLLQLVSLASQRLTHRFPESAAVWRLDGIRFALDGMLSQAVSAIVFGMAILLLLFFVAIAVRSQRTAVPLVVVFFAAMAAVNTTGEPMVALAMAAVSAGALVAALMHYGLLTLVVAVFVAGILGSYPLTIDLTRWFAPGSYLVLGVVAGLTLFAFHACTAGRDLFRQVLGE